MANGQWSMMMRLIPFLLLALSTLAFPTAQADGYGCEDLPVNCYVTKVCLDVNGNWCFLCVEFEPTYNSRGKTNVNPYGEGTFAQVGGYGPGEAKPVEEGVWSIKRSDSNEIKCEAERGM